MALAVAAPLAGCGSSSGGGAVNVPTVAPARQFTLSNFSPSAPVKPGEPVPISFNITMPNGKTLTGFRIGSGPHTINTGSRIVTAPYTVDVK
jgi:hypothetical protein